MRASRFLVVMSLLCAVQAVAQDVPDAPSMSGSSSSGTTGVMALKPSASKKAITLDDAFRMAASQSFDLRIAKARVDEAEATLLRAWGLVLPNISLGAQYTYNLQEISASFGDPEQFKQQALLFNSIANITEATAAQNPDPVAQQAARDQATELRAAATKLENTKIEPIIIQPRQQLDGSLTFAMSIFNARTFVLLPNAYAAVDLVEAAVDQGRTALLYNVARLYFQVVIAQSVVDIAQGQVDSAQRRFDTATRRHAEGYLTDLAKRQTELDHQKAVQQHRNADVGLRRIKAALGGLLGVVDDFTVVAPAPMPDAGAQNADDMLARAKKSRLDLRVQREVLAMADRSGTDAWLRFLPTFQLVAQGRYTSNTSGFVNQPITGAIIVQGTLPIFDSGQTIAAIREASAKKQQEVLRVAQIEQLVEREVRGTVDDYAAKLEASQTASRLASLAREQTQNADALFEAGAITQNDARDAALGAFAADVEAARAKIDVELAKLSLAYVTGEMQLAKDAAPRPLDDGENDAIRSRQ
jgi:outer membrane protein TolC